MIVVHYVVTQVVKVLKLSARREHGKTKKKAQTNLCFVPNFCSHAGNLALRCATFEHWRDQHYFYNYC